MTPSDDLFKLIKSLNSSEKRHFKIYTSKHIIGGQNNYVRLFDAIDKQSVYDEAKIKKLFAGELFIKHLPSEKNYLHHIIMDSLRAFHSRMSVKWELRKMLGDIELLYRKKLHEQALKKVDKALKIACEYEKYLMVYELVVWKNQIKRELFANRMSEEEVNSYINELGGVVDKIANENNYYSLYLKTRFLEARYGQTRASADIKKYDKIINDPLIKKDQAKTKIGKLYLYNILENYYQYVKADKKKQFEAAKKYYELFSSSPQLIKETPIRFAAIITNYLAVEIYNTNSEVFFSLLEKMREIPRHLNSMEVKGKDIEEKIFCYSYMQELSWYIYWSQYNRAISVIEGEENNFLKLEKELFKTETVILYFNIAYLFFATNEFRKSLRWINKIINSDFSHVQEDFQCYARILNLILHFELRNYEFLPYALKSTYRFLIKKQKLFKIETALLNFIRRKLLKINIYDKVKVVDAFKELRSAISVIVKDPYEKKALELFDIQSWLQSKIENKPFAEVTKSQRY